MNRLCLLRYEIKTTFSLFSAPDNNNNDGAGGGREKLNTYGGVTGDEVHKQQKICKRNEIFIRYLLLLVIIIVIITMESLLKAGTGLSVSTCLHRSDFSPAAVGGNELHLQES